MFYYVSIDKVDESTLEFLGYYKITEDEEFVLYNHKGDEIIVDKSDMILKVDDFNDAQLIGSRIIKID